MEVKIVRVSKVEDSRVKASATIVVGDSIMIHGIRVIQGENGLFLSMPSRKDKTGKFVDIVHPVSVEMRDAILNAILEELKNIEE